MAYPWKWLGTNTNVSVDSANLNVVSAVLNATAEEYNLVIDGNITNLVVKGGAIQGVHS